MIREIKETDLEGLLTLYMQLHDNPMPEENGKLVSSCVCVIISNLTRGQRPYAFIENVVTDSNHRGKGLATSCLDFAGNLAERAGCYKIMLLTGSKQQSTLDFYRKAGYNSEDKTAFIRWL